MFPFRNVLSIEIKYLYQYFFKFCFSQQIIRFPRGGKGTLSSQPVAEKTLLASLPFPKGLETQLGEGTNLEEPFLLT